MYSSERIRSSLGQRLDAEPQHAHAPGAALAAVLVPVLTAGPEPRLVFTKRTDTLSRHAGEISFPGGLADSGESLSKAALREADEELGLSADRVQLLGALPSVHTQVSGILIVPFVGLLPEDPVFRPNAAEIEEVLEFPLAELAASGADRTWERDGATFQTFVFELDRHVIWGATARILRVFIDSLDAMPHREEV